MAHQAHNIPWTVLASSLEWRLSNRCKSDASDFHFKFNPDQGKRLTYFVNAFVRNIHDHAHTERTKFPAKYDAPETNQVIVDDNDALAITSTVHRWRKSTPVSRKYGSGKQAVPGGLCSHEGSGQPCNCALPYAERRTEAFLREYRPTICYEPVEADVSFNMELCKTLLVYGKMDLLLKACAHPGVGIKSWWKAQECQCYPWNRGWSYVAQLALDAYILLNVISCFPETWNPPHPRHNDYRRTRSYQFLVWRNTNVNHMLESEVAKYPHRQFFGIQDGQFHASTGTFRNPKRWSHLRNEDTSPGEKVVPFGHLPYEEFLLCQELLDHYVPLPTDRSHVRWMLCEKGLPVEIADSILDLAGFTGQRRLPVPHHPFHPANREELNKYLKYCWQLITRCELLGRALSMQINWQNEVSMSIARVFDCKLGMKTHRLCTRDYEEDMEGIVTFT